jgi:hypothetical protein
VPLNQSDTSAVRHALIGGLSDVVRAPALIIAAVVAMLVIAVPFGAVLGVRLQHSLAHRQPVAQGAIEIDADWWQEFTERADGLAATLTPSIIGFAAPLDNLSSLLDGTHRPLMLMVPVAIAMVAWAFVWAAALERFAHGRQSVGIWRAGTRMLAPYISISVLAAAVVLVLYYTVHPLLFGVLDDRLRMAAVDEPISFAFRFILYVIFGFLLVTISVVADYARVRLALSPRLATTGALAASWRFVRGHAASVFALYLAAGLLFMMLLAAYGAIDIAGGVDVGGWRGVVIAQGYIVARIAVRLTFAASELRLYCALAPAEGAAAS